MSTVSYISKVEFKNEFNMTINEFNMTINEFLNDLSINTFLYPCKL